MSSFRRERALVALLLLTIAAAGWLCAGCATTNVNLTNEARYYTALKWYNDNLETYLQSYRVASPATQAEWKAKIDPAFKAGDAVLKEWRAALGTGAAGTQEDFWNKARQQILGMLVTYNIIQVKEGGK